jgi:hypothetical protein
LSSCLPLFDPRYIPFPPLTPPLPLRPRSSALFSLLVQLHRIIDQLVSIPHYRIQELISTSPPLNLTTGSLLETDTRHVNLWI